MAENLGFELETSPRLGEILSESLGHYKPLAATPAAWEKLLISLGIDPSRENRSENSPLSTQEAANRILREAAEPAQPGVVAVSASAEVAFSGDSLHVMLARTDGQRLIMTVGIDTDSDSNIYLLTRMLASLTYFKVKGAGPKLENLARELSHRNRKRAKITS